MGKRKFEVPRNRRIKGFAGMAAPNPAPTARASKLDNVVKG
jgi:hypothetical protein